MQPDSRPAESGHVKKSAYFSQILKENPLDLLRMFHIILTTAKYRYLRSCIGKGTVVGTRTEIINSNNVQIGKDCLIQDGVYIRAGTQGKIVIRDRAAINSFARLFGHGGIEVGEDAQIGPGTLITTTDHDIHNRLEARFKPVVIGQRAWIAANVTILPGVNIGENAVIGAGSLVNHDIPPNCVAVGVPARVIKEYSPPERVDEINLNRVEMGPVRS
jgi:acetyltransferase-like isoleucine patch superfamily enzyme